MRSVVAVFLGMSLSGMVAMPLGCSGPEWGTPSGAPSSASGSGGAGGSGGSGDGVPIDGFKECSEYCMRFPDRCDAAKPDNCIAQYCVQRRSEIGPDCQDEFDVYYACVNAWSQALPPGTMDCAYSSAECNPLFADLWNCQIDHGCDSFGLDCSTMAPAPNGGTGCLCEANCQHRRMSTLCWMEGMTQLCECSIDKVLVGTCEQAPVQTCDVPRPYDSCCDQYFMLW